MLDHAHDANGDSADEGNTRGLGCHSALGFRPPAAGRRRRPGRRERDTDAQHLHFLRPASGPSRLWLVPPTFGWSAVHWQVVTCNANLKRPMIRGQVQCPQYSTYDSNSACVRETVAKRLRHPRVNVRHLPASVHEHRARHEIRHSHRLGRTGRSPVGRTIIFLATQRRH